MKALLAATPLPYASPSPAASLYESVVLRPVPIPWSGVSLGVAIFILPFVFMICFRRLSRLTRAGLWLVPWLPLAAIGLMFWAHYDSTILLPRCFPTTPEPLVQRAYTIFLQFSFLAFASALVLLSIAGVRRLMRLRRVSV